MEQYQDRWTSYGATTGLMTISDKLSVEQLRDYELFAEYEDRFLEKISPDVSVAFWQKDATLFEQGSYIDVAFFVLEGKIDVYVEETEHAATGPVPIVAAPEDQADDNGPSTAPVAMATSLATSLPPSLATTPSVGSANSVTQPGEIRFLSALDFDLPAGVAARLESGEVVGEIGAMSGWPQSVTARTVTDCLLIQIRVPALRLMKRRSEGLTARLDAMYRERSLAAQLRSTQLLQDCPDEVFEMLERGAELVSCQPDEVLVREGERTDSLFLVRSGFVKLSQSFGEGEIVCTYISKGMTFGEVELLLDGIDVSEVTASSVEYAELVRLPGNIVARALGDFPKLEERLWKTATSQISAAGFSKRNIDHSEFTQAALDTGLVQGNSILTIDLERCTRCDDCVRACAATHGGRPRFVREGSKYKNFQIAKSCYHCHDPVCLVGCPTGAIHRAGIGESIKIDDPICIGCGTCAGNCPYDAIVMHETEETWPADMVPVGLRGKPRLVASKCDLCADSPTGPACVNACPQGCAVRVSNLDEFEELLRR